MTAYLIRTLSRQFVAVAENAAEAMMVAEMEAGAEQILEAKLLGPAYVMLPDDESEEIVH